MAMRLGSAKCKFYLGTSKVKRIYLGTVKVYSAGSTVTYHVDTGVAYTEEVDEGASVLSPTSFTPTKSGWTFLGWRSDSAANGTVLTSKVMGDEPVTLYAVFRQAVTVTYYNNSTTASSTSGYRYYNNGNVVNPSFTLTQAASSGWTVRGWSTSNSGSAAITYANGATFTRDSNITLYGLYQQTITVTYSDALSTGAKATGTRYWAPAGYINPSFTLTQGALSVWTARGWSTSNKGDAAITYANGATFTRDSNITLYGSYQRTITVTYNGNGATSGSTASQSGTKYWGPAGTINPSFTLRSNGFSKTSYNFSGWALNSTGGTQYAAGASVTLEADSIMYAVWTYAGNPYYIVQGYTAKQALSFTRTAADNIAFNTKQGWNAGDAYPGVGAVGADDSRRSSVTFTSGSIATNGNHTISLSVDANQSNTHSCLITINGVTKQFHANSTVTNTFDISNMSSITITVKCDARAYGAPNCGFVTIYLY